MLLHDVDAAAASDCCPLGVLCSGGGTGGAQQKATNQKRWEPATSLTLAGKLKVRVSGCCRCRCHISEAQVLRTIYCMVFKTVTKAYKNDFSIAKTQNRYISHATATCQCTP